MPTLAEATQPRDTSRMVPVEPTPPAQHAVPTPPGPGDGRNPFLICSHPLVVTVDTLRQFYRQGVPQFRTLLFK